MVPKQPVAGSFVTGGVRSPRALDKALRASSELRAILAVHLTHSQMAALNANDFVAVQPRKVLILKGNHILKDGHVIVASKTTRLGDAFWVYVDQQTCGPKGVAVLVVCANPIDVRKDWVMIRE